MVKNNAFAVLVVLHIAIVMTGCSKQPGQETTQSCAILAANITTQESAFLSHLKTIREQHQVMREYDHQMIDALVLHSRELTRLTDADEVSGCFGPKLDDLQTQASEEKAAIYRYVSMLRRALLADPEGVYTD
jgi:2-phospho-L-lactate transferase/gluconeogenesis factor (CofD/UPF0052 family)